MDHPDQRIATTAHSGKEVVPVGDSIVATFGLFPMFVDQILEEQTQDYARAHLCMQYLFVEESDLAQATVVEKQQAFAERGVGQMVVGRLAVLAALQVAVAGLVVPAALPVEHYQQVCSA